MKFLTSIGIIVTLNNKEKIMKKTKTKSNLIPKSKIPIAYLIDYIKEGLTVSDFISSYPWIKRKDVERVLDEIKKKEFTLPNAF